MAAMNLGDSNLKYVNTSRPQLVHSTSKQSVTASDDYYSLTSDHSSNDDKNQNVRYETPPMHIRPEQQQREQTSSPLGHQHREDQLRLNTAAATSHNEDYAIKRKPVSVSSDGTAVHRPFSEASSPTPGLDDTPYIQFAIDQLTRDEEVSGSRRQSFVKGKGLATDDSNAAKQQEMRMPIPPPIPPSDDPRLSPNEDVLVPAQPASVTYKYPRLRFAPRPLRPLGLGCLALCCILMMTALAFSAAYPIYHTGLYDYDGTGTRRYFLFQYLPQILAAIIVVWIITINATIHRIYPFVALASGRGRGNSGVLYDSKLFTTNLIIPNISYLTRGGPWLALWALTFWITIVFTIPLQSCLFQTRFFSDIGIWKWTTVQPVAWALFGIYTLLLLATSALLLRFSIGETGLKWDPRSIADILAIFHRSNILNDFDRTEIRTHVSGPPKDVKLGYWRRSRHGSEAFYCIGDENAPLRRYSLERGKMRPVDDLHSIDLEAQQSSNMNQSNFRAEIHNPALRYRYVPWFLRDSYVLAWALIAIVLLVVFLIVSFVNNAVEKGFLPQVSAPTSMDGFSPADFLYSFVPSFIGMLLFLGWQSFDTSFRSLQPFASLARIGGSSAEKSLLLDYNALLPFQVTIRALLAGHLRVAWISFVGLWSITIPVLAGGVFSARWVTGAQQVRQIASMPGYIALSVFLAVFAFSFFTLFPTRKRYLPHNISTLGELVSFFYQSPLLAEEAFKEPQSKIDLVTKLLGSPMDEKMSARFAFGIYMGQDGREHLGIDRHERPGYGEMLVDFR